MAARARVNGCESSERDALRRLNGCERRLRESQRDVDGMVGEFLDWQRRLAAQAAGVLALDGEVWWWLWATGWRDRECASEDARARGDVTGTAEADSLQGGNEGPSILRLAQDLRSFDWLRTFGSQLSPLNSHLGAMYLPDSA
jgi:hypothetical protein